jgi:hypothetical protein
MNEYYAKVGEMKKKAMEDMERDGGQVKKIKPIDTSKLIQKPVVKVAVKVGKH